MAWYRQGTVSVANGSTAVAGTLTGWTSQVLPEDAISFDGGGKWYEIASVTNNTALVLAEAFAETTITDGDYAIQRLGRGHGSVTNLSAQVAALIAQIPAIATAPADALKLFRVNAAGTAFEIAASPVPALASAPADALKLLRVNGAGTGLEYAVPPQPVPLLASAPADALKLLRANAGGTALEYATLAAILSAELGITIRERLTANRTYYVRTDGSNSNTGLVNNSGGAWLTLQKAYSVIESTLDLAGYTVTVQIGDGTYTAGLTINGPWTGGGSVVFTGNAGTPGNVIVSVTGGTCFTNNATLPGFLDIHNLRVQTTTSGNAFLQAGAGRMRYGNIVFGAVPNGAYHLYVNGPGILQCIANYSVVGGASAHLLVVGPGIIDTAVRTVTITGTPAFGSAYAYATRQGLILANAITFSGTATGPRYLADLGGGIFTNGGGASYFPGNSAGAATSPGWNN